MQTFEPQSTEVVLKVRGMFSSFGSPLDVSFVLTVMQDYSLPPPPLSLVLSVGLFTVQDNLTPGGMPICKWWVKREADLSASSGP